MAMLKPRIAILDETDSGLDIDALKVWSPAGVKELISPTMGAVVITHYTRILDYIQPDHVHVFVDGTIVKSGGPELADKLEEFGYEEWGSANGAAPPTAAERTPDGTDRGRTDASPDQMGSERNIQQSQAVRDEDEVVREIGSSYLRASTASTAPTRAESYFFKSGRGLSYELVEMISEHKWEPEWVRKVRHDSLDYFNARPLPTWGGGDLSGIDFASMYYYIRPTENQVDSWEDLLADIRGHLGQVAQHPRGGEGEARRRRRAQYESEVVYHKIQERLSAQGVIFLDMDSGLREHEELVQQYFATIIPPERQQVRRPELSRLVRRLVHLRPEGRQDRAAASGLFPHQRGERWASSSAR